MFRISFFILLTIIGLTIVFHVLMMLGIFPMDLVWGGRLTDKKDFYIMESISITINLLFMLVILGRAGYLTLGLSRRFFQVAVWIMATLFILNTVGNIFSLNETEKFVFTPITLVLSIASILLNVSEKNYNKSNF